MNDKTKDQITILSIDIVHDETGAVTPLWYAENVDLTSSKIKDTCCNEIAKVDKPFAMIVLPNNRQHSEASILIAGYGAAMNNVADVIPSAMTQCDILDFVLGYDYTIVHVSDTVVFNVDGIMIEF